MALTDNFKSKVYWVEVLKLFVIFFVLFMGFSTLFAHWGDVTSGNFSNIYKEEWANGKWITDVGIKAVISFLYSMYMVSRRMKARTNQ